MNSLRAARRMRARVLFGVAGRALCALRGGFPSLGFPRHDLSKSAARMLDWPRNEVNTSFARSSMPLIGRFERPESVAQATQLLAAGDWAVLAGGTDLYPAHVGRPIERPLLDLSRVAALRGIRRSATGWAIGATTTWTDVIRAELPPLFDALQAGWRAKSAACRSRTPARSPATSAMPRRRPTASRPCSRSTPRSNCTAPSPRAASPRPISCSAAGAPRARDDELVVAVHVRRAAGAHVRCSASSAAAATSYLDHDGGRGSTSTPPVASPAPVSPSAVARRSRSAWPRSRRA